MIHEKFHEFKSQNEPNKSLNKIMIITISLETNDRRIQGFATASHHLYHTAVIQFAYELNWI
ncbi:hypothetical protein Hanom_Chr06g00496311 [Helianthus anomalus]